jgi:hypothetical protein
MIFMCDDVSDDSKKIITSSVVSAASFPTEDGGNDINKATAILHPLAADGVSSYNLRPSIATMETADVSLQQKSHDPDSAKGLQIHDKIAAGQLVVTVKGINGMKMTSVFIDSRYDLTLPHLKKVLSDRLDIPQETFEEEFVIRKTGGSDVTVCGRLRGGMKRKRALNCAQAEDEGGDAKQGEVKEGDESKSNDGNSAGEGKQLHLFVLHLIFWELVRAGQLNRWHTEDELTHAWPLEGRNALQKALIFSQKETMILTVTTLTDVLNVMGLQREYEVVRSEYNRVKYYFFLKRGSRAPSLTAQCSERCKGSAISGLMEGCALKGDSAQLQQYILDRDWSVISTVCMASNVTLTQSRSFTFQQAARDNVVREVVLQQESGLALSTVKITLRHTANGPALASCVVGAGDGIREDGLCVPANYNDVKSLLELVEDRLGAVCRGLRRADFASNIDSDEISAALDEAWKVEISESIENGLSLGGMSNFESMYAAQSYQLCCHPFGVVMTRDESKSVDNVKGIAVTSVLSREYCLHALNCGAVLSENELSRGKAQCAMCKVLSHDIINKRMQRHVECNTKVPNKYLSHSRLTDAQRTQRLLLNSVELRSLRAIREREARKRLETDGLSVTAKQQEAINTTLLELDEALKVSNGCSSG